VVPRACLDAVAKRDLPASAGYRTPGVQPVASHFIYLIIPVYQQRSKPSCLVVAVTLYARIPAVLFESRPRHMLF
jgi:hypothetical protein